MKDIVTFEHFDKYEEFVINELMHPIITDNEFYRKLIRFVLRTKAPIFYYQSDESEYRNFSLYYNFILIRHYDNPIMRAMYFLHDFVHSLFYYPHDMTSVTPEEFDRTVIEGEYAASNETEILVHYRIPELRSKVLQDRRIFFDTLKTRGVPQPHATKLLALRKVLIETDNFDPFFFREEDAEVRHQFKSYRGNGAWCKKRLEDTLRLHNPSEYFYPFLTPSNYERTINAFQVAKGPGSKRAQDDYERLTLMNMRLMFDLLGLSQAPDHFAHIPYAKVRLEGKVLFQPEHKCCD